MAYFADKADCNLFAVWENHFDGNMEPGDYEFFKEKNIKPLKSIKPFTFKNPFQVWQSVRDLNKIILDKIINLFKAYKCLESLIISKKN